MKGISLALFFIFFPLLAWGEDVLTPRRLLSLLTENHPQWEKTLLDRQSAELSADRAALELAPAWYGTPYYSLGTDRYTPYGGESRELLNRTAGLILGGSLRLPSDGTIGLDLTEGWSLITTPDYETHAQTLSLDFSFDQPLFTGGRFINPSAYDARRRTSVDIPRKRGELYSRIGRNSLIEETAAAYLSLILQEEEYRLHVRKLELAREELRRLSSLRERGLYAGADYWKIQLETDQEEDDLLEEAWLLESARARLASSLGLESGDILLPGLDLSLDDIPPLPEGIGYASYLEGNRERELYELAEQEVRLRREGGLGQSPTLLSLELSLTPQYDPEDTSLRDPGESFSDLFAREAWLETALTVSLTYSPRAKEGNRLAGESSRLALETARIDREEKERELRSLLADHLEKDRMLLAKLDRIGESLLYQQSLTDREEKLMDLASGTRLAVEEARLNMALRKLDRKKTLLDLFRNRLAIITAGGGDLLETLASLDREENR